MKAFPKIQDHHDSRALKVAENILHYTPIIFGFVALLLNELGFLSHEKLGSFILAMICFLVTSELVQKIRTMRRIESELSQTNQNTAKILYELPMLTNTSADRFFVNRQGIPNFDTFTQNAKTIDVYGTSLSSISNEYLGYCIDKVKDGCSIRFLLINPRGKAVELVGKRNSEADYDPKVFRKQLVLSLEKLTSVSKVSGLGKCEVRVIDQSPSFGMLIIDKAKAGGQIMVQLFPHKRDKTKRPFFVLEQRRDGNSWLKYFEEQFEALWADSIPWNGSS